MRNGSGLLAFDGGVLGCGGWAFCNWPAGGIDLVAGVPADNLADGALWPLCWETTAAATRAAAAKTAAMTRLRVCTTLSQRPEEQDRGDGKQAQAGAD